MRKTVLLTGATGTIGRATAMELANNNCQLILLGRNSEKLSAARSEIINATGNTDIDIFVAELSEPKSIREAAADIKKRYTFLNGLLT